MSPDSRAEGLEEGKTAQPVGAGGRKTKNLYNKMEWAGAFGDIGTLIPFVVAYITIVKVEPLGLLFMFGVCLLAAGFYYRTPIPIQPMKAIGAAAIAGGISPAALFGSGLTTGLFWLAAGATGAIRPVAKLATKPVVRGIMLGLGLSFMVDGIHRMQTAPVLAGIAFGGYLCPSCQPQGPRDVCAPGHWGWVGRYHEPSDIGGTCQNPYRLQAAGFQHPHDYME